MRLIDASELKEVFRWSEVCRLSILEIIKIIDNAPTIDLDERDNDAFETGYIKGLCENRPHGEWIDRMADKGYVECPYCHKQITGGDLNFCVKCGADMRGNNHG